MHSRFPQKKSCIACYCLLALLFCAVTPLPGHTETLEQVAQILSAAAGGINGKNILVWRDNFRYREPYDYSTPFADLLCTRMSKAFTNLGARVITDPPLDLEEPFFLLSGQYFLDNHNQAWGSFSLLEDLRNRQGQILEDITRKLDGKWQTGMIQPDLSGALDALLTDWAEKFKKSGSRDMPIRLNVVLPDRAGDNPLKLGGKIYQELCHKLKKKKYRRILRAPQARQAASATYMFATDSNDVILRLRLTGSDSQVSSEKRFPAENLAGELLQPEIIGPRKICIQKDPSCPVSGRSWQTIEKNINHFLQTTVAEYGVIKNATLDEQCPDPGEPSAYHLQVWVCFDSHEQPASRFPGQAWHTQQLRLLIRDHRGNPLTEITGNAKGLGPAGKEKPTLLMDEKWWQDWRKEALRPFLEQIARLDLHKL